MIGTLESFAAIDFETANEKPCSVCSVGIVVYRNRVLTDKYYSLIRPEPEYYSRICQRVHGIRLEDTENERLFPEVWAEIEPIIEGLPLVAHNAPFDSNCLKSVFRVYQMDYPDYVFLDTLSASRRFFGWSLPNHRLNTVAAACGYCLENHHHALADAEACAAIALKIL